MALNAGLGFNLSASDKASFVFGKVGKSLGMLQKSAQDTSLAYDNMSGRVRDASSGRFAKQTGIMSPQWLEGLKGSLGAVGQQAKMMGQAFAGVLGAAADESTKFGLSMGKVASITDRAAFPMSTIESITKDMAATYGGDINMQADTLYQAVSSGASDAASAIALMHSANQLAIGGLSNSFAAVDALTNVLNAYGMSMTRAGEVSDSLFVTAKIGKTTIDQLASQIGRVAPTANAAGVSMDEMFAVITAGSSQLGNAAAPIDGLKEMLSGIMKPTSDAAKEAKRLGIEFDGAALRSKGFKGFFDGITASANYNADSFTKLFGSMTAFNLASVLASNGGAGLTTALEGMANKAGAAEFSFKTLADTADFAKKQLAGNLQTALVNIGQVISPILGMLLVGVNSILEAFNKSPPIVHTLTAIFITAAAGSMLLVGALVGVALAMASAYVVGTPLLFALGGVALAFGLVVAAALPFILVGAAIYTAWNRNIGGFADKVTYYVGKAILAFEALGQLFSDGALSGDVMSELSDPENSGIESFALGVFLWFGRVKNFVEGVGDGFSAGLERVRPTVDLLVDTFERLWSRFQPISDSVESAQSKFDAFGDAGLSVGGIFAEVVDVIVGGVNTVLSYVDGLVAGWDTVTGSMGGAGLEGAVTQLFAAFQPLLAAFDIGTGAAGDFGGTAHVVGAIIGGVLGGAVKTVTVGFQLFNAVLSIVGGVAGALFSVINMLYRTVYGTGKMLYQVFTGDVPGALATSKEMVGTTINAMIDLFADLVLGVAGAADSIAAIFGKDLGARAAVQKVTDGLKAVAGKGLGVNVTAAGTAPEQNSPAVLGQIASEQRSAEHAKSSQMVVPPITANVNTTVALDGDKLGEKLEKLRVSNNGRANTPTPPQV